MAKRKPKTIPVCGMCQSPAPNLEKNITYTCGQCGATGMVGDNWHSWAAKKDPLKPPEITYMPKKLYR